MTSVIYKALFEKIVKKKIECVDLCCVCLEMAKDGFSISSDVNIVTGTGAEVYKQLRDIFGYLIGGYFDEVSSIFNIVCETCKNQAVSSYSFILNSKAKAQVLLEALDNIEDTFCDEHDEESEFKSLYLIINDIHEEGILIQKQYDNKSHVSKSSVLQSLHSFDEKEELNVDINEEDIFIQKEDEFSNHVDENINHVADLKLEVNKDSTIIQKQGNYVMESCGDQSSVNAHDTKSDLNVKAKEEQTQDHSKTLEKYKIYKTNCGTNDWMNNKKFSIDMLSCVVKESIEHKQLEPCSMEVQNDTLFDNLYDEKYSDTIDDLMNNEFMKEELQDNIDFEEDLQEIRAHKESTAQVEEHIKDEYDHDSNRDEDKGSEKKFNCEVSSKNTDNDIIMSDESVKNIINLIMNDLNLETAEGRTKQKHLERHMKRMLVNSFKQHQCSKCKKRFNKRDELKQHLLGKLTCLSRKRGTYICDHCGYVAIYKLSLQKHIAMQHMRGGVFCDLCEQSFTCLSRLNKHKISHIETKPYECTECNSMFKSVSSLRCHMKNHSTVLEYECEICNKTFKNASSRWSHVKMVHSSRNVTCVRCKKVFKNEISLTSHMHKIHKRRGSEANVQCSQCTFRTISLKGLEAHTAAQHARHKAEGLDEALYTTQYDSDNKLKYSCTTCGHQTNCLSKLEEHFKFKHEGKRPYTCDRCGKTYGTKQVLQSHIKLVHGRHESHLFQCEYCERKFKTEVGLKSHESCHKDERPYSCKFCEATFKTYAGRSKHMHKLHASLMFPCDESGKQFRSQVKLNNHRLRHEGGTTTTGRSKFPCEQCGCTNYTKKELEEHIRYKHAGVKQFLCEICNKAYGTRKILHAHLKTHTERPLLYCDVCEDKSFLSVQALKVHMNGHTGETPYECRFCKVGFRGPTERLLHERRGHADRIPEELLTRLAEKEKTRSSTRKKYRCDQCTFSTTFKTELEEHINYKHHGNRPFICETCGKSFGTTKLLARHNQTHLNRVFPCDLCENKSFKTPLGLKIHMHSHTGAKPYVCKYCGEGFSDPSTRLWHQKKEHPEKFSKEALALDALKVKMRREQQKQPCEQCDHVAKSAKLLEEHVNYKHRGLRPYYCDLCDTAFGTERSLKDHHTKKHVQLPTKSSFVVIKKVSKPSVRVQTVKAMPIFGLCDDSDDFVAF